MVGPGWRLGVRVREKEEEDGWMEKERKLNIRQS